MRQRTNMKQLKRTPFLRYLILSILAVAIGGNVYALNASRLAGNEVPMPFGVGASVVLSGSMEPALSVGDLLILQEQTNYIPGDVVVYQSGSIAVVHRLVALEGENAITRGDANNAFDEPIPAAAIKGKVIAAIPVLGYLIWAMKTPVGILLTIAAAVILVEMSYRSEKAEDEDEKEKLKAEIRQLMKELEEDPKN